LRKDEQKKKSFNGFKIVYLPIIFCFIISITYFIYSYELLGFNITFLLMFFLLLIIIIPFFHRLISGTFDFAETGIWFSFFFLLHFWARAILILIFGSKFINFNPKEMELGLINNALLVSIVAIFFFWLGYHWKLGPLVARAFPEFPKKWNIQLVWIIALLCSSTGWLIRGSIIYFYSKDILGWLFGSKDEFLRLSKGIYYLLNLSTLATISLFLLLIVYKITHKAKYKILFGILFIPELIYSFLSGKRSSMPFLLLSLYIALYMLSDRGHKKSLKFLGGTALLLFLLILSFPVISNVRFQGINSINNSLYANNPSYLFRQVSNRLHGLDSLALIIKNVPRPIPYTMGEEFKLLAVAWIPRKIWEKKPVISIGEIFLEKMVPPGLFPEGASVIVTLPGQFYWDLGFLGVILGMLIIGVFWRVLQEYLVKPKDNLSNTLIVSFMFSSFFLPLEQTVVTAISANLFKMFMIGFIIIILSIPKGNK